MNVISGQAIPAPTPEQRQRNGLLAKIHIAKQQMGLNSGEYEAILRGFKAQSAADLSIPQLERLVKYLKHLGWKPARRRRAEREVDEPDRLQALRKRVLEEAKSLKNWETRLPGLINAICGVVVLNWVRDSRKLERLLAVIGKIRKEE